MSVYAKVIADSVSPDGQRITTVELRYWRAIHAEIMTHRDRARNAASSRAIPFYRVSKERKTKEEVEEIGGLVIGHEESDDGLYFYVVPNCTYVMLSTNPYIPEFIGAEQKGMQSGEQLSANELTMVRTRICEMLDYSLDRCKRLYDMGVHKSIINRYLEPWSYITVVMTATEWKNFFRLRIHPKAEKHFNQIANLTRDAINASTPVQIGVGGWHLPYVDRHEPITIGEETWNAIGDSIAVLKQVSAARCARVSYLTHDGKRDMQADINLFNTLMKPPVIDDRDDDVIHSSPLEHVATPIGIGQWSGPFNGWGQFRKEYANENVPG